VSGYGGPVTESGQAGPRLLRAAALAVVTVALALAAHLLGGGPRPSAATLGQAVVVLAVAMAVVMTLRAGRPSMTGALVGLGGSQLLLHQWFVLATPGECAGQLASHLLPGGHLLTSVLPWGLLAQTARACATTGDASATMLTAAVVSHALATLLTGALVARGEALLSCAVALVLPALPTLVPVRSATARAETTPVRALTGTLAHRHVDRRGPPVAACAD
jgi:hypothetical protein